MIFWGLFVGGVLGALWPGSGDFGTFMGGVLGWLAGLTLRAAVRNEISTAHEKIRLQLLKQLRETVPDSPPARSAPIAAQAIAPDVGGTTLSDGQVVSGVDALAQNERRAPMAPATNISPLPAPAGLEPASAMRKLGGEAPKPPGPRPAVPAAAPNAIELALNAAKTWLMGGNTIVRVGLVVLFIGLAFLARYASEAGLLPVEFRLAAVGAAGIALLVFGFSKRAAKPGFALALQGGGVAVMYLTVFAAFRLYALVPPLAAFGLMIVVCALSCVLALLQNAPALAVAAFAGGFAVPVLLSTGQGSHVGLFSYYTVLNLAILFIAWKRAWRILNMVGFLATFGVASAWGVLKYQPAQYASTQPFLVVFVLIYVLAAILYARNTPTRLGNAVDSTLVFGTPLIAFGLQAGLVRHFEFGAAFSALGFAALYLGLATVLVRRALDRYRLLIECFIALGVGFVTLAVPLALDVRWTSAVWALEGAGAFWVGMRQARWMPRAFGLLLQGFAALAFLQTVNGNISALPLANPVFMGALFIALPAFAIAWWLRNPLPHSGSRWARIYSAVEPRFSNPVYLYAFGFWCLALVLEISRRVPGNEVGLAASPVFAQGTAQLLVMLAVVTSCWLSQWLGHARNWAVATWPSRVTLVVLALALLLQIFTGHSVLQTPAWAVWPLALGLHFWMLRRNDDRGVLGQAAPAGRARPAGHLTHAGGVWLLTFLLADCLWFWIGKGDLWRTSWASVVMLVSAMGVLLLLALWGGRANQQARMVAFKWPLNPHAAAYYWSAAVPLAVMVFFGVLLAATLSPGRTAPLPYIPLLNPTDLSLALAMGALVFWRRAVLTADPSPAGSAWVGGTNVLIALAGLGFMVLNTVWLRVAHHFFGVRWDAGALFDSFVVQTGYAILWTLLALGLMVFAHRRLQRSLWLVGAGLLGLVVLKLLVLDLSNVGGAERIIAFIAVGAMMLVVGYFAPLPPRSLSPAADFAPTDAASLKAQ